MRKTTATKTTLDSLAVNTEGLQQLLGAGRRTCVDIGTAAGAKITIGKRVLWNVSKVKTYLDEMAE